MYHEVLELTMCKSIVYILTVLSNSRHNDHPPPAQDHIYFLPFLQTPGNAGIKNGLLNEHFCLLP